MVPASEYDALIDIFRALAEELTMGCPVEAVEFVEDEFGHDIGEWTRRILIDHETARELFPPKAPAAVGWTVRLGVGAWHVDTEVQAIDREDAIAQAQALHPEARTILGYWTSDRSGGNR